MLVPTVADDAVEDGPERGVGANPVIEGEHEVVHQPLADVRVRAAPEQVLRPGRGACRGHERFSGPFRAIATGTPGSWGLRTSKTITRLHLYWRQCRVRPGGGRPDWRTWGAGRGRVVGGGGAQGCG